MWILAVDTGMCQGEKGIDRFWWETSRGSCKIKVITMRIMVGHC